MAREQSPAFQFYPQDFLSDRNVIAMDLHTKGAYILLLCHCWIHGSIPSDDEQVRRLVSFKGRGWASCWEQLRVCFVPKGSEFINPRIERERQKQAEYRKLKHKAGIASANKRAMERQQTVNRPSTQFNSSSSSSSSSSSLTTNNKLTSKRKAAPSAQTPSRNGHEKREEDKNVRVITKIAHEVLRVHGHRADADAIDAIKTLCAKRHIAYDSETVRKALDSAETQSA